MVPKDQRNKANTQCWLIISHLSNVLFFKVSKTMACLAFSNLFYRLITCKYYGTFLCLKFSLRTLKSTESNYFYYHQVGEFQS